MTPLHTATQSVDDDTAWHVVRALLAAGADQTIRAQSGMTPLDLAKERGLEQVGFYLFRAQMGMI